MKEDEFFIAQLFKQRVGKKVVWSFTIDGVEVRLTTSQFISQPSFRQRVIRATGILPPRRSLQNYEIWVNSLLKNVIEKDSPTLDQRVGDV